ncbi:MAG: sulfotransferase family 2 domain-containing protein [bacterium]
MPRRERSRQDDFVATMTTDTMPAEGAIIFLHIPKTAGTTLHRIIERQYRSEELYSPGLREGHAVGELAKLSQERRAQIRMFRGHLAFGVDKYLPVSSTYMTVLREPIDRVISYYYYIRRTPHHYLHDFIGSGEFDLKGFVDSQAHVMIDNAQTRVLSGVWHGPPFGECTQEMLETAKTNLRERFAVVGLTERFDETLLLMKRTFGWRNVFYTPENVSHGRPDRGELPPDTLKAVAGTNQFDIALYQYATQLFEEQVARQGPSFGAQVRAFQLVNKFVGVLIWGYWQARKVSVRVLVRRYAGRLSSWK